MQRPIGRYGIALSGIVTRMGRDSLPGLVER